MFPHREPQFHSDWWSIDRLFPILLMLLLIGVVIWAVVRFTRQPRVVAAGAVGPGPVRSSPLTMVDAAVEQARLRYSRGEVDRDTFLQIVGDLSPGGDQAGATDEPPPSATS
jgi:hypothetical protein